MEPSAIRWRVSTRRQAPETRGAAALAADAMATAERAAANAGRLLIAKSFGLKR